MPNRETKLIVLRGPSGSGKSSVSKLLRTSQSGPIALIEQDYLRRTILKEKDVPGGLNIELIKMTVLMALENSFDAILEGIFDAGRYGKMFEEIIRRHPRDNHFFYFDISFEGTLLRHQHKQNRNDFGETEMRRWYKERNFLECAKEVIIPETNNLEETTDFISSVSGLSKKPSL